MKKFTIKIDDKKYPCRMSLGAILRFKEETGKEVSQIDSNAVSEMVVFLWCCVKSACEREKVKFELSVMDFANAMGTEDLATWTEVVFANSANSANSEQLGDGEKKTLA